MKCKNVVELRERSFDQRVLSVEKVSRLMRDIGRHLADEKLYKDEHTAEVFKLQPSEYFHPCEDKNVVFLLLIHLPKCLIGLLKERQDDQGLCDSKIWLYEFIIPKKSEFDHPVDTNFHFILPCHHPMPVITLNQLTKFNQRFLSEFRKN